MRLSSLMTMHNGIDENGLLSVEFINSLNEKPKPGPSEIPIVESNDYAGTHDIVWNNIKFPVTGNYQIEIEVDDEVELKIGNNKKGRGYVTINKDGFTNQEGVRANRFTLKRLKRAHMILECISSKTR